MMMIRVIYILLIVIILLLNIITITAIDIDKCTELGFNSTELECKACNSLERIIGISETGNAELVQECKSCCTNKIIADEQYEYAVLEVDKRFISFYPNIDAIVTSIKGERKSKQKLKKEQKKKKEPVPDVKFDIEIKYRFGSSPHLLLYKNKGDELPAETISVSSWDLGLFKEYLDAHIKK